MLASLLARVACRTLCFTSSTSSALASRDVLLAKMTAHGSFGDTMVTSTDRVATRRLLRLVLNEALDTTERKRVALEEQLEKNQRIEEHVQPSLDDDPKIAKARIKAARRAEAVPERLADCLLTAKQVADMLDRLGSKQADLPRLIADAERIGLGTRLRSFDVEKIASQQYGRPAGFDGLVVDSPHGVPILVARRSFSDALLRRIGRGNDLFFQVRHRGGSRVLLRTSMLRNLARSPRECMEMAADLAVYFSDWRHATGDVEVMFTDSRHVAKRGGRVGQLKDSKRLGLINAQSSRVASIAREAQEVQGWLS